MGKASREINILVEKQNCTPSLKFKLNSQRDLKSLYWEKLEYMDVCMSMSMGFL